MAMRLLPISEFYAALRKAGFEKTAAATASHTMWLHLPTSKHYSVPHDAEAVPDSLLDMYLQKVGKLYTAPQNAPQVKMYSVKEKAAISAVKN